MLSINPSVLNDILMVHWNGHSPQNFIVGNGMDNQATKERHH
jgi:hypothetical protein